MSDPIRRLAEGWRLSHPERGIDVPLPVPGDVHSALLEAGEISDPYWRDTEPALDWVHETDWVASCRFTAGRPAGRAVLTFAGIDCISAVVLNGVEIGRTDNAFRRYDFDVTAALAEGDNLLEVRLLSASAEAARRAAASTVPTPHIAWNCRIPHYNFLRKVQCDAGWDWNIALSPLGLTGDVVLRDRATHRLDEVSVRQVHRHDVVRVEVTAHLDAWAPASGEAVLEIDGARVVVPYEVLPGASRVTVGHDIRDPRLWWPAGQGAQEIYDLRLTVAGETREMPLGLRDVALVTDADDVGHRFAFRVNGREVFMCGANWIPADALPARRTPKAVRDRLTSAREANMNMIRVWGGGQHEPDWFYELCTELGIMVWQDFMFSCNLYPAHDRAWLEGVRVEARQQVRRLTRHACLALWCGDNELVGALGWFDESKADRDRYLAIYDRLNRVLEDVVVEETPGVPWWPSSPSVGPLNFGDGWHDDTSGDMHFWDVWHSAKEFEHYRSVRPRFCSEFGFQSFPSPRVIDSFTQPQDRNVSSRVMEVHQRNAGGNSRIVETLARYFRFPDGFDDMAYLSQVSQALAMKTAIEFWRVQKPRCMGTLYWQLNDTWPVASWASLEYGGGWKLTQYMARHFFAPVLVTGQPGPDGTCTLWAVCDRPQGVTLTVTAEAVAASGGTAEIGRWTVEVPSGRAVEVGRFGDIAPDAFVYLSWITSEGTDGGDNTYLPGRPKDLPLAVPTIDLRREGDRVELSTDVPALFVTWDLGGDDVWSDNGFTLLPGRPRVLTRTRARASALPSVSPRVQYLRG